MLLATDPVFSQVVLIRILSLNVLVDGNSALQCLKVCLYQQLCIGNAQAENHPASTQQIIKVIMMLLE